jgi:hypothetical protein
MFLERELCLKTAKIRAGLPALRKEITRKLRYRKQAVIAY